MWPRTTSNPPLQRPGASVAALPLAPAAERQYRSMKGDVKRNVSPPTGRPDG